MAYSSPLGSNFRLERSISASKEEKNKETPKGGEYLPFELTAKKSYGFDNQRQGRNSQYDHSPRWQRNNSWKSPNQRYSQEESLVPISQYYHPSMLEDPWEELEKNLKQVT